MSEGKLHYKKMRSALLHEQKLKLNKTQILIILNLFDINQNPDINYYKASLIIRNMIQELFSSSYSMQKVELLNEKNFIYTEYEDLYDTQMNKIKEVGSNLNLINFSCMFHLTLILIIYLIKLNFTIFYSG